MFRFTIRDVLWLTVVVALGLGWGLEHWQRIEPIANVRGHVYVGGTRLQDGWIGFEAPGAPCFGTKTNSNGEFEVPRIPVGEYTVTIEHPTVSARYASPQTSLKVAVRAGINTIDFDLK